jgi:hypothetical protein
LWFCSLAGLCTVALAGCGYRSVYARPEGAKLSVQVGQVLIPEPVAAQAAASGVRSELAAAGRLGSSAEFPRLVLDVLRVDELSRGVHVQDGQPRAGGMSIALTVRGRVFGVENQEPQLDTGDVRRSVQVTGDADPRVDSAAYDVAGIMRSPHPRLYVRAFGNDPAFWRRASPSAQLLPAARPMLLVCSSPRRASCAQAEDFEARARTVGVHAAVLPMAKSHFAINEDLGKPGSYAAAVDRFAQRMVK